MIQAEPIFLVVTGERSSCRVYLATRYGDLALAFATAFAHDPARPHVEEFQAFLQGADFAPGLKPFTVTLGREGPATAIDRAPSIRGFGQMNDRTEAPPNVQFHVWARDGSDAERIASNLRGSLARQGGWPEG